MKMKKIISLILVIATLLCFVPMFASAEETRSLVSAVADNDTSDLLARFSLTEADDGRVETDKSVNYNTDGSSAFDYNTDEFSVTLSAMGQAYTRSITEETETEESMHTDVLFILDVSSSMYDNKMSGSTQNRVYGTVQALNTAINKLKEADPDVRFGIICYGTNYYAGTTRNETATTWTDSTSKTLTTSWQKVTINNKSFYAKYSGSYNYYSGSSVVVHLNTTAGDTGAVKISNGIYYKINGVIVKNNGNYTISCSTGSTTKSTTISYESGIYLPIGRYSLAGSSSTNTNSETYTATTTRTAVTVNGTTIYIRKSGYTGGKVYLNTVDSKTGETALSSGSTTTYQGLAVANNNATLTISYTTESTSTVSTGEWVTYTANVATSTDRISTSANIRDENGNAVAVTSRDVATNKDGTYTQAGLQAAVTMFSNVIDKENRVPATVLVTDGVPTIADEDIYTVDAFPGNSSSRDEMLHSIRNIINYGYASYIGDATKNGYPSGTPIEAGLTIKTALEVKKRIDAMYEDADALYFTIGPGVDYNFGKLFLDPSVENMEASKDDTTENSAMYGAATPKTLYDWLSANMTDSVYNELTTLADYSIADNFTIEKYEQAMEVLVGKIVNKTVRPVVINKTSSTTITPEMSASNYIYFEDTLDNMVVKGTPCIVSNDILYTPIATNTTATYTEYRYELNNVAVYVYADKVVWIFGSELLPLLMKGMDGYDTVSPIRCIFKVGVDVIDDINEVFYTNDSCTAKFTPVSANPYYKNYTKNTISKESNITDTLDFVCEYNPENDDIIATFGNNGKIEFDVWFNDVSLVLDYGLPVEYNIKNDNDITNVDYTYTAVDENGKYGHFTVDTEGNTRYEINTMRFVSEDTFDVAIKVNSICGVNADLDYTESITYIPAKIIYFEDDFVTFDNNWEKVGTTLDECQADDILGDIENNEVYGRDTANDACVTYSMGSAMKATVNSTMRSGWPTATFTFTGTGLDVISVTDNESMMMTITIKNAETNKVVKRCVVSNYYGAYRDETTGEWDYEHTSGDNALYQIPILRFTGLDYATYNITLEARYSAAYDVRNLGVGTVYVDAIRIYTPSETCEQYYVQDNEGYAQFINIHKYIENNANEIDGMMYIDGDGETVDFNDLCVFAPNNEIYLDAGQSIGFLLGGDASKVASVQIGFKSVDGKETSIKVVNNDSVKKYATSSCTDQYYEIGTSIDSEYTITNRGSNLVSITNIKVTYSSDPTEIVTFRAPNRMMCMAMIAMPEIEETTIEETTVEETTIEETTIEETTIEETTVVEETTGAAVETETSTESVKEATTKTTKSFIDFIRMFIEFFKKMFNK